MVYHIFEINSPLAHEQNAFVSKQAKTRQTSKAEQREREEEQPWSLVSNK